MEREQVTFLVEEMAELLYGSKQRALRGGGCHQAPRQGSIRWHDSRACLCGVGHGESYGAGCHYCHPLCVRKQGFLPFSSSSSSVNVSGGGSNEEVTIMNYTTHAYKLVLLLAQAYALYGIQSAQHMHARSVAITYSPNSKCALLDYTPHTRTHAHTHTRIHTRTHAHTRTLT